MNRCSSGRNGHAHTLIPSGLQLLLRRTERKTSSTSLISVLIPLHNCLIHLNMADTAY